MKTAVFAGTFDPITTGHEYVVKKALETFDKVIVVVADNDKKMPLFTSEERRDFIMEVFKDIKGVEVAIHHGLMMDFMKAHNLTYYIRGIRNDTDKEYEDRMLAFNKSVYPELQTIYLDAPESLRIVSSTFVKANANKLGFIPEVIRDKVKTKLL